MAAAEQTLLVARPTRLIALRYWVGVISSLVVAAVVGLRVPWRFSATLPNPDIASIDLSTILAGVFIFLAFASFLAAELKRRSTRYVITDNKIIREDGILNKNTQMIPYTQLERVDVHQTLGQRILKIGTIVVDTGDDKLEIEMVRHPAKVQELLSNRLGRKAWTGQPPSAQQAPPTR